MTPPLHTLPPGTIVRPRSSDHRHLGVGTVVRTDPEVWGEPPDGFPIAVVFTHSSAPYYFAADELRVLPPRAQ